MKRRGTMGALLGATAVIASACLGTPGSLESGLAHGPGMRSADPDHPFGDCWMFPPDSYWWANVSALPVHPSSDAFVDTTGRSSPTHPDFGAGLYNGAPIGIPFNVVDSSVPPAAVEFLYSSESDGGPYPIPQNWQREGGPTTHGGDRHILMVNTQTCVLSELFAADPESDGTWNAGSGAVWNLSTNAGRPTGWTSADAAGMAILPGLVRYDEVASGSIDHALRMTVPTTRRSYVWPASHQAGSTDSANAPPMGTWFRLKSTVDPGDFTGQSRVIVEALQNHGAIVADNGSGWFLSGAPDQRWNNSELRQLRDLTGDDWEAVDVTSLEPN